MTSEEPQEEFSIHWIRDIVEEVLERDTEQYLIVTGKSMSGSVHIGFMKEIISQTSSSENFRHWAKKQKPCLSRMIMIQ
jgi:lysyl-tRNA synthetase class I